MATPAEQVNQGFTDAQGVNNSPRDTYIYKDFSLFFTPNPVSGDVTMVTDVQDIKRSVRNLVLTNRFDKPFHPEISSGIRDALFELMTPVTAIILARQVQDVIENFEPRARLVGVKSTPNLDRNEYEVTIEFYVVNAPTELIDLTLPLERLR